MKTQPAAGVQDLFAELPSRRRVLLGLLSFTLQPRNSEEFGAEVDHLQEHDCSVYSPAVYSALLERHGALTRVDGHGYPIDGNVERQPEVIEVDGAQYYRPAEMREAFWQCTEAGRAYLEADRPLERLLSLLDAAPEYRSLYLRVLEMCSAEGGCSAEQLGRSIDVDPAAREPRRYAAYFIERLERCDALTWKGTWRTTEAGRLGLEAFSSPSEPDEQTGW